MLRLYFPICPIVKKRYLCNFNDQQPMKIILNPYLHSESVQKVKTMLAQGKTVRCSMQGLCGSAKAIAAVATAKDSTLKHIFVMRDKESASFFYSDLEQLSGEENADFDSRQTYFLPDAEAAKSGKLSANFDALMRTKALQKIRHESPSLIVTYPQAIITKVIDEQEAQLQTFSIASGDKISMDELLQFLNDKNFEYTDFVSKPSDFALRGSIIDVFSYVSQYPYRIEFDGNYIASLRTFEIETQLSKTVHPQIVITPNLQNMTEDIHRISILKSISPNTVVWFEDYAQCMQHIKKIHQDMATNQPDSLILTQNYITDKEFDEQIRQFSTVELSKRPVFSPDLSLIFKALPQVSVNKQFEMLIEQWFDNYQKGICNVFCSTNDNQSARIRNMVRDVLGNHKEFADLSEEYRKELERRLVVYEPITLHEGFVDENHQIACYTDHQLFERYHRYKADDKFRTSETIMLKDIYELQPGDFITHIDHGIGRYAGLEKINVNGKQQETIKIVYKENDILYISIHSMHRIAKYAGKDGIEPALNRLGGNAWNKVKEKTKIRVKALVIDLAKLYAERKIKSGFAYSGDSFMQAELEASFIYEDTPDQLKATADVKADMESPHPMDRLICGDVGFGKTEIAIRAAFKAVSDSKQVAVLVPTTVLALQHYNTFSDRLANFPCTVDYINRFRSSKEQKQILENIRNGKVDIIIGTHKILSQEMQFKDLGLIIIDEEQKFGVGAKEKLRSLKVNVDTLAMTATPIPRTLQFSLIGARDISIMKTPPLNRYPIETELCQFCESFIKNVIEYELSRGGQVFFVHNRVHNIGEMAGMIQQNFPEHKVAVAHGQMRGDRLERIMLDFMDGCYDILVCTTIIESGLDIPNANTIIVNDAQNFGLSELHQLRGRVGRKNKKAFCYLLTPPAEILPEIARKRLRAIEEYSDIGSGLNIAMRDLDIRGAGDLLGAEQSGFIAEIGYEMYEKILQEAIFELQQQNRESELTLASHADFVRDCIFETDLELLIPDNYVHNHIKRYQLYKELNSLATEKELQIFRQHVEDRFGKMPPQTEELIKTITLRNMGKKLGAEKLALKQNQLICYFPAGEESSYYQSSQFSFILNRLQQDHSPGQMREKNRKLTLHFPKIDSIDKALEVVGKFVE
jgi:transcription-repair coupling factor (superfamily II helicase)